MSRLHASRLLFRRCRAPLSPPRVAFGIAIWCVLALVAGCGGGGGEDNSAEPRRLTGHVIAPVCGGGYDIEASQIVVHNATGEILATSTTSDNVLAPIASPCLVSFAVAGVRTADFYQLQVGGHSGPAYSQAELAAADFSADLRLGGTELPNVSANSFCSSAAGLDTLLGSAPAAHRADWRSGVGSYLDVLTEFAGTQLLGGPDPSARQLTTVSASLLAATRTASTSRAQLHTANRLMPGVMRAYGCGDRWTTAVAHVSAPPPPPPAPAPVSPPPPTATVTVTPYSSQPEYGGPPFPGTSLSTALQYQDRTDVSLVQARLNALGYGPMPVDGSFGPVTRSWVLQYQANHGLIVDGVVGPQTWGALFP